MPKISEMRESKFLKQTDVGTGVLVTITDCDQMNVAMEGAGQELKWCLHFKELEKPLVLNQTNIASCAEICEAEDTDLWRKKRVVLYTDPTVMYAGKRVGGIRIRKPKATAPPPVEDNTPLPDEDDIPF